MRYLLLGGQAMRLCGMPRFSMDWDLFNPPRDQQNLAKLNAALGGGLKEEVLPFLKELEGLGRLD